MKILLLALGMFCAFGCGSSEVPMQEPTIAIEPAEIEVAKAAIASWWAPASSERRIFPGQVVIDRLQPFCASLTIPGAQEETPSEMQAQVLRRAAKDDPLLLEAVEDFLLKREEGIPTALLVEGIQGLDLQSQESVSEKAGGRDYSSYGNLSRVGLSQNGQLAVVANSWFGGPLMAYGRFSVFEKVDGRWEPSSRKIKAGWIS